MVMTRLHSTVMYSQLQPWSTVEAFPCLEQVHGSPIPHRVGISYQVNLNSIQISFANEF